MIGMTSHYRDYEKNQFQHFKKNKHQHLKNQTCKLNLGRDKSQKTRNCFLKHKSCKLATCKKHTTSFGIWTKLIEPKWIIHKLEYDEC